VEVYQDFKMEALLVFIPNYQFFLSKNLAEILKKLPKKERY